MLCVHVLDSLPREYQYEVRHFQAGLTPTTLDRIEQRCEGAICSPSIGEIVIDPVS